VTSRRFLCAFRSYWGLSIFDLHYHPQTEEYFPPLVFDTLTFLITPSSGRHSLLLRLSITEALPGAFAFDFGIACPFIKAVIKCPTQVLE
jgi:hypothetical protein